MSNIHVFFFSYEKYGPINEAFSYHRVLKPYEVTEFYASIHMTMDVYIVHVLLRGVLSLAARIMRSYWFDMENVKLNIGSVNITALLQPFLIQLQSFRYLMEFYHEQSLNTLGDKRRSFENECKVIEFAMNEFSNLFKSDIKANELSAHIDKLRILIDREDLKLITVEDNLSADIDTAENIQNIHLLLTDQMVNINTVFVHIVEVKLKKWLIKDLIVLEN